MREIVPSSPQPFRRPANWLPMLIGPAGLLASVGLSRFDDFFQGLQNSLETPAPFLIGLVAAIYLARSVLQRNGLFLILAVLAAAMTLREIHDLPGFHFTKKGIYVALVVTTVWAVLWRGRLAPALLADRRHTTWLAATFLAYFLAVLVQRRVFRFIPGEQHAHRPLEECAETIAHAMFLVTALLASWRKAGRRSMSGPSPAPEG